MKKRFISFIAIISSVLLLTIFFSLSRAAAEASWRKIEEGLFYGQFYVDHALSGKQVTIDVVKINPTYHSFKLLCASELGRTPLIPRDWCRRYHLISAINAGMYQKDGLTSVGYMKNFSHLNNPRLNPSYKAVLAFNRVRTDVPEIQIIDLACQNFDTLKDKYNTYLQNIRLVSCKQENVWSPQEKRWSLAVLGIDKEGNALFIFSEAPFSGHEFANILLSLPLSIFNAMYLEGGREAGLYLSAGGVELERTGTYGSILTDSALESIPRPVPVPNVLGFTRKSARSFDRSNPRDPSKNR